MVACHLQSLVLYIMLTAFTFSIVAPDLALDLWLAFLGVLERHKARMLARKNRQLDDKMKKYWVIDMRRLR